VSLGGFIQVIVSPFVFDEGEKAEGRVAAGRIVEAFDELADGDAGLAKSIAVMPTLARPLPQPFPPAPGGSCPHGAVNLRHRFG
jgi:hypothetical protein